jgi:hypothetical protein
LLSGPVVVHAPAAGCATELADAYRFLYAPAPASPPTTSTVTIACHPGWRQEAGLTTGSLAKGGELERELFDAIESCTLDKGVLRSELRGPVNPPAWLAATLKRRQLLERPPSGDNVREVGETLLSRLGQHPAVADAVHNALQIPPDQSCPLYVNLIGS